MVPRRYSIQRRACARCIHQRRCFWSSPRARTATVERVHVPLKSSNGSITLDVYRPNLVPSSSKSPGSILLYLPHGYILQPQFLDDPSQTAETLAALDSNIASALADESLATVVQINYRVSPDYRFPTAIHDILAGFDWSVQHLTSPTLQPSGGGDQREPSGTGLSDHQTRIGVCGQFIGGTLALSLALTECRLLIPEHGGIAGRIVAAAVNNPVVNWILPSKTAAEASIKPAKRNSPRRKKTQITTESGKIDASALKAGDFKNDEETAITLDLLKYARKQLFTPSRPADWFDPFASPILFLRTSGSTVAGAAQSTSDIFAVSDVEPEDFEDLTSTQSASLSSPSYAEIAADDTVDLPTSMAVKQEPSPSDSAATRSTSDSDISTVKPYKPRKVPLKYPPTAMLPVAFPSFRLSVSAGSELAEQGAEMVALLRRALGRFEFPASRGVGGVKDDEWEEIPSLDQKTGKSTAAEEQEVYLRERIALEIKDGKKTHWDVADARRIGAWFKEMFAGER